MRQRRFAGREERGSTLLIVLALLALLVLIAATLSVSVRMELVASQNYGAMVAANNATQSALFEALSYLDGVTSITHRAQPWAQARYVEKNGRRATRSTSGKSADAGRALDTVARPYDLTIDDLAGRLNLNAVKNADVLARWLAAIMPAEMAGGVAARRAAAVLAWRGDFVDTQTTACLDPRLPPPAGFHRIENLDQLAASAEHPDLFTPAELQKLRPYATVFSVASESQTVGADAMQEKVLLEPMSAETIYERLVAVFPDKQDRLLRQYAVNLADLLDGDSVPAQLPDPENSSQWSRLLGIELTPLITEVYADSATKNTDEGQFVELYNPWSTPMSVEGWQLVVGGASGGSGTGHISLNGTIAPEGYLIVTDRYEQPAEGSEPGTGSFLAIFGRRADGGSQRVIEAESLQLPDKNSCVSLLDAKGQLVDAFPYSSGAATDGRQSYQRVDPLVRWFTVAEATPFELYSSQSSSSQNSQATVHEEIRRVEKLWRRAAGGQAIGLGDLFAVPTSYVAQRSTGSTIYFDPYFPQTPELGLSSTALADAARAASGATGAAANGSSTTPNATYRVSRTATGTARSGAATNLDARLVDIFVTPATAGRGAAYPQSPLLHSYGKVNINTCAAEALWGLDASANDRDLISPQLVNAFGSYQQAQYQAGRPPFTSLSQFVDLVAKSTPELSLNDTEALSKLLDQVCVGSMSFDVWAQSPVGKAAAGRTSSLPSVKAHWILGLDFRPCSIIHFAENSW
jgi:hypothetical protein